VLVIASVSALNVTLADLAQALDADQRDLQWIVDSYSVVLAAFVLGAGAVGDRVGRRRSLIIGLCIFGSANGATLLANGPGYVIALRCVAAFGAALIFPATLSTITTTFTGERRARGIGLWATAASAGGFGGILLAGFLVEHLWWGSVFLTLALCSAAVLVAVLAGVPESVESTHSRVDVGGTALITGGIAGIVFAVIEGPVDGWTSPRNSFALAIGISCTVLFVWWERRVAHPILDVSLFTNPALRSGAIQISVLFFSLFGFFFVAVQYLAYVRGFSPLQQGLGLLPLAITLGPLSNNALRLAAKFGAQRIAVTGLITLGAGLVCLALLRATSPYLAFAACLLVIGTGAGLVQTPATDAIVSALPAERQGVASGLNDVTREFAGALGIAVIGAAFNNAYRSAVADSTLPKATAEALKRTPAIGEVIARQQPAIADAVRITTQTSFMTGLRVASLSAAAATLLGAIAITIGSRTRSR
jgi:EmrB/QacA subfamily drug resistance transporter